MTDTKGPKHPEAKEFNRILGLNIGRIRERRGLDQSDLERELHLKSSGALSQVENGLKGLPAWRIKKLETYLNLPQKALMRGKEYTEEELEFMDAFMEAMQEPGSDDWQMIKLALKPRIKKTPSGSTEKNNPS